MEVNVSSQKNFNLDIAQIQLAIPSILGFLINQTHGYIDQKL